MNDEKVKEIVAEKVKQVDDAVESIKRKHELTARQDAYTRIIELIKTRISAYYARYPERALDERSHDVEDWLVRALHDSLGILDEYEIEYNNGGSDE